MTPARATPTPAMLPKSGLKPTFSAAAALSVLVADSTAEDAASVAEEKTLLASLERLEKMLLASLKTLEATLLAAVHVEGQYQSAIGECERRKYGEGHKGGMNGIVE